MSGQKNYQSFAEFYPYYIAEHSNPVCRAFHYTGSMLVLVLIGFVLATQSWVWLWLVPLVGYGVAWIGHFVFERNRPATFKYPLYSLMGDWVMLKDFLMGRFRRDDSAA